MRRPLLFSGSRPVCVSPATRQALLVGTAVTVACLAMNLIRNHAGLHSRHFELGTEYFHIAVALREGRGFSDPFGAGTGATGWMPPGYAWLLWLTNLLTRPGERLYSDAFVPALIVLKCLAIGVSAGLTWSVLRTWRLPRAYLMAFPVAWTALVAWAQWEQVTTSTHDGWWIAFIACLCVHGMARLASGRPPPSLALGLCLAALSSPVLYAAAFVPLAARGLTLAACSRAAGWRSGLRPVLPALLLSLGCAGAWSLRVHAATGIWAPVKTNAGFELWQAQERTDRGVATHSTFVFHPASDAPLREEYVRLKEKAFLEKYTRAATAALAADPARFLGQVLHRAQNALLWMQRRRDTLQVAGVMLAPVRDELTAARLVAPEADAEHWRFLFLDRSDQERAGTLARLSPQAGNYMRSVWQHYDAEMSAEPWVVRLGLRELAHSGLVSLAWALFVFRAAPRVRRRLLPVLFLYAAALAPYILVSHYYRYQEGLIGLQVIAVVAAAGACCTPRGRRPGFGPAAG